MTPPLWKRRRTKESFDESERGEWKTWLKTQHLKKKILASGQVIQSHHFMANRLGKQWKQWQTLFSWASKITADGDCSHEIKRHLLLGRKVTTKLDSILKSRDITLPTKVHLLKAMAFPIVMYRCESWTIKKAEHWSCVVVLETTLQSPLDSKEIKPVHPKGWCC